MRTTVTRSEGEAIAVLQVHIAPMRCNEHRNEYRGRDAASVRAAQTLQLDRTRAREYCLECTYCSAGGA
jgi:hypothetical protein